MKGDYYHLNLFAPSLFFFPWFSFCFLFFAFSFSRFLINLFLLMYNSEQIDPLYLLHWCKSTKRMYLLNNSLEEGKNL